MARAALVPGTQLTELQNKFVDRYFETGDAENAVIAAGYNTENPAVMAWNLMKNDRVIEIIARRAMKNFVAGAPVMMSIVESLARNETVSPRVRLEAAKTWLDRAGLIAPKAAEAKTNEAPLHEMTIDELRAKADAMALEISNRAHLITPIAPASETDLSDIL